MCSAFRRRAIIKPNNNPSHRKQKDPMAGAVASCVDRSSELLQLLNDVVGASKIAGGVTGVFQKDCTDLVRRITLLTHLFEEIRVFKGREFGPSDASTSSTNSSPTESWVSELVVALQAAKRLVLLAANFTSNFAPPPAPANYNDEASKKISFQFQCVTWKLEKALGDVRYDQFDFSEEVEEQVELVRAQLRRAIERYGSSMKGRTVSFHSLSQSLVESGNVENNATTIGSIPKSFSADSADGMMIRKSETFRAADTADDIHVDYHDDIKKPDANSSAIPDDFICPISLELMRDPVIVATGQTYERSYIQRWVDCGNTTCPKTQQKLVNLTLTPNYVLRSLIAQWCINNNIEQLNGKIKKSDGSFRNITGDTAMIQALVCKLSSRSIEERRAAAAEIRSLSKRSTDNRILIAEAGAIPVLANLLTSEDGLTQENAVTSVLNLSIYDNNKGLIMLAGAVPSIVQVLRAGSMEMKENAAATLFSLSLADENKIIIGASGAIPALIELLQNGSTERRRMLQRHCSVCAFTRATRAGLSALV